MRDSLQHQILSERSLDGEIHQQTFFSRTTPCIAHKLSSSDCGDGTSGPLIFDCCVGIRQDHQVDQTRVARRPTLCVVRSKPTRMRLVSLNEDRQRQGQIPF